MMRKVVWMSVFVLATATGFAFASSGQHAKFHLPDEATFAGKRLPAGNYTVSWTGDPANLEVTISKGHGVLAEGKGKIEEAPTKYRDDAVVCIHEASGALALSEIEFGGKSMSLVLQHS
jgi:hypothetical protein